MNQPDQAMRCPNGHSVRQGASFCPACGVAISGVGVSPEPGGDPPASPPQAGEGEQGIETGSQASRGARGRSRIAIGLIGSVTVVVLVTAGVFAATRSGSPRTVATPVPHQPQLETST